MANTLVKLKTGTISKLEQKINGAPAVQLNEGTVYFAIDTVPDKPVGQIVYDAPDGNGGVARIVMSTRAEYADDADTANNVTGVVQVAHGGTGAINVADARTNLELGNAKIFYGTCSVNGGTAAKTVTCSAFTSSDLTTGAIIFVTFSNTNSATAANLTMSVNGTTAKPIKKYYNYAINNLTNAGEIRANATLPFVYDGTNWIVLGLDYNSTWSAMSQDEATAGTSTSARLITAAVLQAKIANSISNALSDTNAMIYKGTIATASDVPAIHEAGWTYKVVTAGTYVGQACEVGDVVLCVLDGNTTNNDDWIVIQKNVDNALFKSTNTFTDEHMLLADGTNGKVKSVAINPTLTIKDGDASNTPTFKISVGGKSSSESSLSTATTGIYGVTKLSNTSSASEEGLAATPKGVWTAINTLDGVITGTPSASKTATAFSQTNGKVTATFEDIAIAASQVTSGTLSVARGGTGQTSIANIKAGKDADGNTITTTYATKDELNSLLAANDAMVFKGLIMTASDVPAIHEAGWTYKIATFGTYAGKICEVGDLLICVTDNNVAANASDDHWMVVQTNVDNALFKGLNTYVDGHMLLADGTVGKVKSVAINPTITLTGGTATDSPKFTFTIGNAYTSNEVGIGTATTGIYGVTKLSDATNSTATDLAATANAVKKAYDLAASKTSNVGTITGVTAGTGLSGGGTSGNITINHSNSITAINSEDLYKIKYDAQGHITGASVQLITDNTSNTDVTSTDTNLITGRTLYYQLAKKGYTTNTGTVTSVTAGTGLNTSADQADSATKGSITTTGTLYLTKSGVTAGSYGPSANATPAYNATFNVPYITVDAYGRVTAASTKTVKIPATDNTDTKQNITLATNLKAYITGVTTAPTSTANALTGVGDTGVYLTTIAGELNATQYKVNEQVTLQYNSTTKSLDFIFAE